MSFDFNIKEGLLEGAHGSLKIPDDDQVFRKIAMLIDGECNGIGPSKAAKKYNYCTQRYYQLLNQLAKHGTSSLINSKRGPKSNYRKNEGVVKRVIRFRFLDPDSSASVIAQKLRQSQKLESGFT